MSTKAPNQSNRKLPITEMQTLEQNENAIGLLLTLPESLQLKIATLQNWCSGMDQKMERNDQKLDYLETTLATIKTQNAQGLKTLTDQTESVHYLTECIDAIVRKLNGLSEKVIEREVREPLYLEQCRLISEIAQLVSKDTNVEFVIKLEELVKSGADFLLAKGIQLIHPQPGDNFQPAYHRPIAREKTKDPSLEGQIADCHRMGLIRDSRTLQPALVSIYEKELEPKSYNKIPQGETEQ